MAWSGVQGQAQAQYASQAQRMQPMQSMHAPAAANVSFAIGDWLRSQNLKGANVNQAVRDAGVEWSSDLLELTEGDLQELCATAKLPLLIRRRLINAVAGLHLSAKIPGGGGGAMQSTGGGGFGAGDSLMQPAGKLRASAPTFGQHLDANFQEFTPSLGAAASLSGNGGEGGSGGASGSGGARGGGMGDLGEQEDDVFGLPAFFGGGGGDEDDDAEREGLGGLDGGLDGGIGGGIGSFGGLGGGLSGLGALAGPPGIDW